MAEMQNYNGSSQPHLWLDQGINCIVTLICWAWFLFGFMLFFSWRYLITALVVKDPEQAFQRFNSQFYRVFFRIVKATAPRQRIEIDEKVAAIRSSVIVCNHLSYLDPLLLIAAGKDVNSAPTDESQDHAARWVNALDKLLAKELLLRLLIGDTAGEKARLLAEIRDSQTPDGWPTSDKQRSLAELLQKTAALRAQEGAKQARKAQAKAKREAAKAERERADRMKEMLKDPDKWLREAEQLVDARGTRNYKAAAEILHDLREAVGGDEGAKITRRHAAILAKKHPTLNHLKSSLRKRGLLE